MKSLSRIRSRGIALGVVLLITLVLALLSSAAVSMNFTGSKATLTTADAEMSFQNAETAVRAAEVWLQKQTAPPPATCTNPCSDTGRVWTRNPSAGVGISAANLRDKNWWAANGRLAGRDNRLGETTPDIIPAERVAQGSAEPMYVIEDIGADPGGSLAVDSVGSGGTHYYQITAKGSGNSQRISTIHQIVFAVNF